MNIVRLKPFLPRSFFGRSLLILLLPVVLAQAVATYIFFDRHWENLTNRLAYGVVGDIALAVETIRLGRLDELAQVQRHTDLRVKVLPDRALPEETDTDGLVNSALDHNLGLRFNAGDYVIIDRTPERLREVLIDLGGSLADIEIPERRLQSPTAAIFLLWMSGSAIFFLLIAVVFMRNQIRPIRRLAEAAESFGKGQEVIGFKPEGALELRRAAQAFLVMRERIQRQIRQRTEMLAGVSHDLRTPLTRMKLQLALLKPQPGLDELQMDITEMEQMVEGYLAFARGEGGEQSSPVDLSALLESVVADARRADESRALTLHNATTPCPLIARPQALRRCLHNLIGNALRYANKVDITLNESDKAYFIYIDDDGPGIPEDKREDVLRPFVRLEESRNLDTGGVGLGLTIARDIARAHGGDLQLLSSPMGGLRALVRLPH